MVPRIGPAHVVNMKIPIFQLERNQSLWENLVDYNLSESGVHPLSLKEVFNGQPESLERLIEYELGYSQTNGTLALRERIAALYPEATPDNILVTNGTSEANFVSMWALFEPGDELIVMLPNYLQIYGLGSIWQGQVHPFNLRLENGWRPDLDDLQRHLGPQTRAIAICNPNNPTGAILNAEDRSAIIDAASRYGTWIIADEVYQGAEHAGEITTSFWNEDYDRIIVTNGLSKAYGLPGLRLGWIVAPEQVAESLWSYRDYTTIAPATLSDRVAQRVLEPETRERIFQRTRSILETNFEIVSEWSRPHSFLRLERPRAGAIALFQYDLPRSSEDLVEELRRECSVLLCPGAHFGLDKFFRLGYGGKEKHLRKGLEWVSQGLLGMRT
ncbi:MAG: aminotransferase class I/II-fold pyridoxal phosphate-dependent enzyme [Acidobacteriota bacterium]